MKGLELPINILIIIAIAVIVLIALIAMFYPAFSGGSQTVSVESVKSAACQILVTAKNCNEYTKNINITNFDANQNGDLDPGNSWVIGTSACGSGAPANSDSLAALCDCYYQINSESKCKALCGC